MDQNPISYAFEQAHQALGFYDLQAAGAERPHARIAQPAVATTKIDLTRQLVAIPSKANAYRVDDLPSGQTIDLSAAIIERSRVAQAGARVIIAAEKPSPQELQEHYFYDVGIIRALDPAPFGAVADGANAVSLPLPFHDVLLRWPDAPSIAVSFDVSRQVQKGIGGGAMLEQDLTASILEGLALAADKALIAAILAANPAAFSFGAAAARFQTFDALRGLIGTNGTGASVASDGTLRAGGIPAELTAATTATVIGAFKRAAVAIRPEVRLHVKRMDVNGNLNCTLFASIQGLVPDSTTFWTVS